MDKAQRLNQEINATFDRAFNALREEMQDHLRESYEGLRRDIEAFKPLVPSAFVDHHEFAEDAAAAEARAGESRDARAGAFGELRAAISEVDRARSQFEVLAALLAGSGRFASRAALLLLQGNGELRGWGSHGFADSAAAVRALTLPPAAEGPWSEVAAPSRLSAADCALLCGRVESPLPELGYLVPLVLRDRVVALLYADQTPSTAAGEPAVGLALAALQSLVYTAGLAIESLAFRQRPTTATLTEVVDSPPASAGSSSTAVSSNPPAAPEAPPPANAVAAEAIAAEPATQASEPAALAATGAAPSPAHPAAAAADAAEERHEPAPRASEGGVEGAAVGQHTAEMPSPFSSSTTSSASSASSASIPTDVAPVPPLQEEQVAEGAGGSASSPYLDDGSERENVAATEGVAVAAPAGMVEPPENATVMLPHAALRDVGVTPWGRRTADLTKVAPDGPEDGAHSDLDPLPPARGQEPEGDGSAPFTPPSAAATETWGSGGLRAVPPMPSHTPAPLPIPASPFSPAGASDPLLDTQRAPLGPIPVGIGATLASPSPASSSGSEAVRGPSPGSVTPEVRPPSGVQGPGWAFATTRMAASTASDEAMHEEARRLARLLVSEIKLYNEEQVEAGRRNRDIYERLREDIDRSRQMYEERIEPRLLKTTDYFYQELVRILAAGDSKALGI